VLSKIADSFPIRYMITALVHGFESGPGSGLRPGDLSAMAIGAAAALLVTARRFKQEPKHR
jgi:hypothetical protein